MLLKWEDDYLKYLPVWKNMIRMELEVDRKKAVLVEDVLEWNCMNLMEEIDLMIFDLILLEKHSFEGELMIVLKVVDSFVVELEVVLKVVNPLQIDSFGVVDLKEAYPLELSF